MPPPVENDPNIVAEAVALLRAGQVVGMPTETVYGLAADALRPEAAARIFAAKQRPLFDPLIVHVADREGADACVSEWHPLAETLAAAFWPGPLTLVLPKRDRVPDLVTSGLPLVAVRVPAHPLALALLRAFGGPLAAPSANRFGRVSPTTAAAVREELGDAVPLVLDGGPCAVGLESTIVAFPQGEGRPVLLRAGGVPVEALEKIVGPVSLEKQDKTAAAAPGQLPQHYAPRTPLRLVAGPDAVPAAARARTGLLGWGPLDGTGFARVENLSESGDFTEAATRLFAALRRLDGGHVAEIAAILLPERDLGRAVNDRLRRAAHA